MDVSNPPSAAGIPTNPNMMPLPPQPPPQHSTGMGPAPLPHPLVPPIPTPVAATPNPHSAYPSSSSNSTPPSSHSSGSHHGPPSSHSSHPPHTLLPHPPSSNHHAPPSHPVFETWDDPVMRTSFRVQRIQPSEIRPYSTGGILMEAVEPGRMYLSWEVLHQALSGFGLAIPEMGWTKNPHNNNNHHHPIGNNDQTMPSSTSPASMNGVVMSGQPGLPSSVPSVLGNGSRPSSLFGAPHSLDPSGQYANGAVAASSNGQLFHPSPPGAPHGASYVAISPSPTTGNTPPSEVQFMNPPAMAGGVLSPLGTHIVPAGLYSSSESAGGPVRRTSALHHHPSQTHSLQHFSQRPPSSRDSVHSVESYDDSQDSMHSRRPHSFMSDPRRSSANLSATLGVASSSSSMNGGPLWNDNEETYVWNSADSQLYPASSERGRMSLGRPYNDTITFRPRTYIRVFERDHEILPSTGNSNTWLKSQNCVPNCRFRSRGKRPAVIRSHLAICKLRTSLEHDPLKRLCQLQIDALKHRKAHLKAQAEHSELTSDGDTDGGVDTDHTDHTEHSHHTASSTHTVSSTSELSFNSRQYEQAQQQQREQQPIDPARLSADANSAASLGLSLTITDDWPSSLPIFGFDPLSDTRADLLGSLPNDANSIQQGIPPGLSFAPPSYN